MLSTNDPTSWCLHTELPPDSAWSAIASLPTTCSPSWCTPVPPLWRLTACKQLSASEEAWNCWRYQWRRFRCSWSCTRRCERLRISNLDLRRPLHRPPRGSYNRCPTSSCFRCGTSGWIARGRRIEPAKNSFLWRCAGLLRMVLALVMGWLVRQEVEQAIRDAKPISVCQEVLNSRLDLEMFHIIRQKWTNRCLLRKIWLLISLVESDLAILRYTKQEKIMRKFK